MFMCVLQEGAYLYHPKANSLEPVTKEDLRPAVGGGQGFCRYCSGMFGNGGGFE